MASNDSPNPEISTTPSTTRTPELYDLLYPVLLPVIDPAGTYQIITSSINMGIFGKSWTSADIPDLSGKVYFVTGGNIGLGKETILQLAKHNAEHIYLGARTQSKAEAAIADIKKEVPNAKITFIPIDLASLESVRAGASRFQEQSERLDVLINNAGIMAVPNGKTTDGYEIQFGTNHVGSFALTKFLLPMLQNTAKSTGDARIVNLTSEGHNFRRLGGLVLDKDKMQELGGWQSYGNSKLANILHAKELAKRYPDITSASVHPGVIVGTGLYEAMKDKSFLHRAGVWASSFILPDVPTGALGQLWAATAPKEQITENGGYYVPVGKIGPSGGYASSKGREGELWDWTEKELASKGY